MRGEYSSAKNQWLNWECILGPIAPLSREKLPFLKKYQNQIIHLVLSHFHFWPAMEKCYCVSISMGCENNQSAKWRACVLACFVCFLCLVCLRASLACSRALRARVLYELCVLTCLTCFIKWRAWRASLNGMLGVL